MKRIPEPELMDEAVQAKAYAEADFEEPHSMFIDLLVEKIPDLPEKGFALDLGCGPADISIRFAQQFPDYQIDAVDGSNAMLLEAEKTINARQLNKRINLVHTRIEELQVEKKRYNCIFSNSLLHHLHDPGILWSCIKALADDSKIFVMDLLRPESAQRVDELVEQYAADEPDVLKKDFRNSLFAAFICEEVTQQLQQADLSQFNIAQTSDRHMIIYGKV